MSERLQKVLARHGLGSRREIERWIGEGRVTVNRVLAKIGEPYLPGDRVAIDGKEVTARLAIEVNAQALIYHKAQGQPIERGSTRTRKPPSDEIDSADEVIETPIDDVATMSPALDELPAVRGSRWVAINPMHAGDSGLLLATNDGNLGFALTRRKRWIPTAYMVRVLAPGSAEAPPEIPLSISYDDGRGQAEVEFTKVESMGGEGANLWYRVELERADRRAAVRALFESMQLKVSRMTQVVFGHIELPRDLPRGRSRALTAEQLASLYELAQLTAPTPVEERARVSSPPRANQPRTGARRPAQGRTSEPRTNRGRTNQPRTSEARAGQDDGSETSAGRVRTKQAPKKSLRESRSAKRHSPAPDRRRAPKPRGGARNPTR